MTDLEISKALALAIGYGDDVSDPDVQTVHPVYAEAYVEVWFEREWRRFDYRDEVIAFRVAERFDCFPRRYGLSRLWSPPQVVRGKDIGHIMEDTPQKAIALAVIQGAGK